MAKKTAGDKIYTETLASAICARIAAGESVRRICRTEGFPSIEHVLGWALDEQHPFAKRYQRAREMQAEILVDEILDISDDGENDTTEDSTGKRRINHDVIQRSKLRVDARRWFVGKILPRKFGDKITGEIKHEATDPLLQLLGDIRAGE